MTAGRTHTCVVTSGAGMLCWGGNVHGELGDGTTIDRIAPTAVSGMSSGVLAITAGEWHTCALTLGGTVKCWGYGAYGGLGDGTTDNHDAPVTVSLFSAVAPAVSGVAPATGPGHGGTEVTVTGTGFASGASVTCGGVAATNVVVVNATTLTAITPAHGPGTVDVVVTNSDSQRGTLASGFTYVAASGVAITAVSPSVGPGAGGTSVTITGTGFVSGATVTFGGVAATNVTAVERDDHHCDDARRTPSGPLPSWSPTRAGSSRPRW